MTYVGNDEAKVRDVSCVYLAVKAYDLVVLRYVDCLLVAVSASLVVYRYSAELLLKRELANKGIAVKAVDLLDALDLDSDLFGTIKVRAAKIRVEKGRFDVVGEYELNGRETGVGLTFGLDGK